MRSTGERENVETGPRSGGIDAVLFDWDGTVVDSWLAHVEATQHVFRALGRAAPTEAEMRASHRLTLRERLDLPSRRMAAPRRLYSDFCMAHHPRLVVAFPGVERVLAAARNSGVPTALVSNQHHEVGMAIMRSIGLTGAFDVILFGEDIPEPKPSPSGLLLAAGRLGVHASRSLYLGDTEGDVIAARGAGMSVAVAAWGSVAAESAREASPDYWWATVEEAERELLRLAVSRPALER